MPQDAVTLYDSLAQIEAVAHRCHLEKLAELAGTAN
jgi:hypothetical protein